MPTASLVLCRHLGQVWAISLRLTERLGLLYSSSGNQTYVPAMPPPISTLFSTVFQQVFKALYHPQRFDYHLSHQAIWRSNVQNCRTPFSSVNFEHHHKLNTLQVVLLLMMWPQPEWKSLLCFLTKGHVIVSSNTESTKLIECLQYKKTF